MACTKLPRWAPPSQGEIGKQGAKAPRRDPGVEVAGRMDGQTGSCKAQGLHAVLLLLSQARSPCHSNKGPRAGFWAR